MTAEDRTAAPSIGTRQIGIIWPISMQPLIPRRTSRLRASPARVRHTWTPLRRSYAPSQMCRRETVCHSCGYRSTPQQLVARCAIQACHPSPRFHVYVYISVATFLARVRFNFDRCPSRALRPAKPIPPTGAVPGVRGPEGDTPSACVTRDRWQGFRLKCRHSPSAPRKNNSAFYFKCLAKHRRISTCFVVCRGQATRCGRCIFLPGRTLRGVGHLMRRPWCKR